MAIVEFFSTPIWSGVSDDIDATNSELLTFIDEMRNVDTDGVSKTNVGGWQSDNFDIRDTPHLSNTVMTLVSTIRNDLNIRDESEVVMTGCWVNVNTNNSFNRTHTHPNSMLSGCYYIKTPESCGEIVFEDPRSQALCLPFPVKEKNKYTVVTTRFSPRPGCIVVFPSWLPHFVEVNNSDEERISVAFNIYFS